MKTEKLLIGLLCSLMSYVWDEMRVQEIELYCECRMPEMCNSYFGYPVGDMIECTNCNEWFHKKCKNIAKKFFEDENLDYFCNRSCKSMYAKK